MQSIPNLLKKIGTRFLFRTREPNSFQGRKGLSDSELFGCFQIAVLHPLPKSVFREEKSCVMQFAPGDHGGSAPQLLDGSIHEILFPCDQNQPHGGTGIKDGLLFHSDCGRNFPVPQRAHLTASETGCLCTTIVRFPGTEHLSPVRIEPLIGKIVAPTGELIKIPFCDVQQAFSANLTHFRLGPFLKDPQSVTGMGKIPGGVFVRGGKSLFQQFFQ